MSMRWLLLPTLLGLLLCGVSTAEAGKGKKKNHGVHGKIEAVDKGSDKDSGSITVKVHARKKKGEAAPATQPVEKKFVVSKDTKIEFVSGKKGAKEHKPATFADLASGERVRVTATDSAATSIVIHQGKKKAT